MSIYDDQSFDSISSLEDLSDLGSASSPNRLSTDDGDYLSCYSWYVGKLTRLEAEACLETLRNGAYLIRKCASRSDYTHAIAIRWSDQPYHIRLYRKEGAYSVVHNCSSTFNSVEELVSHFQVHTLASQFPSVATTLLYPYREETERIEAKLSCKDFSMQPDYIDAEFETDVDVDSVPVVIDTSAPLIEQTWYHGRKSRREAEDILNDQPDFSFLLRDSESVQNGYSLSIRDRKCGFIHLRIADQAGSGFVLGQYSRPFDTLADCIAYYCRRKLNIKGISHETLQFPVSR